MLKKEYVDNIMTNKTIVRYLQGGYLKHIVLISSIIISTQVALHQIFQNSNELFKVLLFLNMSSILLPSICLYIILRSYRRFDKDYTDELAAMFKDNRTSHNLVLLKNNKTILVLEGLSFLSFLLSIIALVSYVLTL